MPLLRLSRLYVKLIRTVAMLFLESNALRELREGVHCLKVVVF